MDSVTTIFDGLLFDVDALRQGRMRTCVGSRYFLIVSSSLRRRGKSRSAYQRDLQSFTIPSLNP